MHHFRSFFFLPHPAFHACEELGKEYWVKSLKSLFCGEKFSFAPQICGENYHSKTLLDMEDLLQKGLFVKEGTNCG